MKLSARAKYLFSRYVMTALFASVALVPTATPSAEASYYGSATWEVTEGNTASYPVYKQVVGTTFTFKFKLLNPMGTSTNFLSSGVGTIASESSDAGFSTPTSVTSTSFIATSTSGLTNIATVSVTSSVVGTQTFTVQALDPKTGTVGTVDKIDVVWVQAPTTGITIDYKVGGTLIPASVEYVSNQNGVMFNPSTDYSLFAGADGRIQIGIAPGTYIVKVNSTDNLTRSTTELCTVTDSHMTDCSISLSAESLKFNIQDSDGTALSSSDGVQAYVSKVATNKVDGYGFWLTPAQIDAHVLSVQNGKYIIYLFRSADDAKNWNSQNFTFSVTGGAATFLWDSASGTAISADSDSKYPLRFPTINFVGLVTAGGVVLTTGNAQVNNYNPATNTGTGKSAAYTSSGILRQSLLDGINTIYLYNYGSNAITYLNSYYKVVVASGVVTSVKNAQNEEVAPVSGVYPLPLTEANVQGIFTMAGVAQQGYISQVFDLATSNSVSFQSSYINSEGKFGLRLNPGRYRIVMNPNGSPSISTTCEVASSGTSTCNIQTPGPNLKLEIDDLTGVSIGNRGFGILELRADKYTRSDGLQINSERNSYYVSDGDYVLTISSNNPATDGQARSFKFTVLDGVVSDFTDTLSNEVLKSTSGTYKMKLLAPNFTAYVNANGSHDPNVNVYVYQAKGQYQRGSNADANGSLKLNLPNGLNIINLNPTRNESPTVVAATYSVQVTAGAVVSVSKDSGETLTADSDGIYTLDLRTPNIIGSMTIGGVATTGSIYSAWNTVLNNQVSFNTSGIDSDGNYAILVPAGNYDFMFVPNSNGSVGSVQNCTATAGVQTRCDVTIPLDNLKFGVSNSSGTLLNNTINAYINRQNISGQSFAGWWNFNIQKNSDGQFHTSLLDGKYTLTISSTNPMVDGVTRLLNFTVASGAITSILDPETNESFTATSSVFTIPLKTPNLKATVIANGQPAPYVSYYGYRLSNSKFDKNVWYSGSSDSSGNIGLRLDDGTYFLHTSARGDESPPIVDGNYTIVVDGGEVTSVTNSQGQTVTKSSNFYQLVFATPNVLGHVTVAGNSAIDKNFWINNVYSIDKQNFVSVERAGSYWIHDAYALRLTEPGSYLISVGEYQKSPVMLPCTVAASGNSTCDLDIPADNFKFKIQGSDGADLFQDVSASINLNFDRFGMGFGINMQVSGLFSVPLQIPSGMSGTYSVNVYPTDGSSRHGINTGFKIELNDDGKSIRRVTRISNGVVVTPDSDGLYAFRLDGPNLAGTVVAPDGTTPIPNTSVQAIGPQWIGMGTDSSGAFATRINLDGDYQVFAQAPTYDMTKANSASQTVTISNGSSNTSMVLTLRVPDVVGTVTGPNGVSKSNYIQILKDDGTGVFNYLDQGKSPGRPTDSTGKFAFYLDPGNYKFQAQADLDGSGGSSTVSSVCVVPTQPASVKDCSFNLNSSNIKFQVLGGDGKPYRDANIYYNFMGDKSDIGSWPTKTWDYSYLDSLGRTKTFLENGRWNVQIQTYGTSGEASTSMTITVAGGVVTSMVDASGHTLTLDSSGYYQLSLPVSNLLGSITEDGKIINYGAWVGILKDQGDYFEYVYGNWVNSGKFSFLAAPGTYAVQVVPYPNKTYSSGSPVATKNLSCVVPEVGTVTCNVALKTGNFLGRITTPAGALLTNSYAYIYGIAPSGDAAGKKALGKIDTQITMNQGLFSAGLDEGEYRLVVQPDWNSKGGYTQKIYKIEVGTSTVVTDLTTNSVLTIDSASGRYNFAVGLASVTGKVFKTSAGASVSPYGNVVPVDISTGQELWEYASSTNMYGEYALTLPEGTYDLIARTWGGKDGTGSSSSNPRRVHISSTGTLTGDTNPVDLYLRDPNLTLKVVLPGTSTGVAYSWVNGFFNDHYFGGMTDSLGNFQAFVETGTANTCVSYCQITVYPNGNSNYIQASHSMTTIGNLGNLALGQITSKLSIRIPTNGDTGLPDKWSWASVDQLNETGTVVASIGYGTDQLGQTGLGLITGTRYRITAYPSGDYYGRYSPKTLDIPSFDPTTQATLTITFDSPNVTFIAVDRNGDGNSWGWFEIEQQTGDSTFTSYLTGYLNSQGRGASYLPDGTYRATFYPGKAIGIARVATFKVLSGHVASSPAPVGISFNNDVGRIVLANGNITGTITSNANIALPNIPVTAEAIVAGETITVSAVTKSDGTYEMYLDPAKSWRLSALDPVSAAIKQLPDLASGFGNLVKDIKFD